jgi:NADPH:quinone reductase-like Zn-dependent oxidoreductase
MRAAGIRQFGANVELLELPEPRSPAPDEVLIRVVAAGAGNWDEIVRQGGWDVGA